MNIRTTIDGMEYGGTAHNFYWNPSINPEATVKCGLPNCTMFAYSAVLEGGLKAPVDVITDASNWHNHVTNGWIAKPYHEYKDNIKVGDILEWSRGNHVAVISSVLDGFKVSASFYTGIHGKAYYGNEYDTREGINSLKELCDYFYNDYQYRFFHYCSLEEENKWCNSEPDYVLVAPSTIFPVDKDTGKNQIYVGVNGLRVRTEPNVESLIKGIANVGYYNAEKTLGGEWEDRGITGNVWYKIGEYYVASVDGVDYYEATYTDPAKQIEILVGQLTEQINKLQAENALLKAKLEKIKEIVE